MTDTPQVLLAHHLKTLKLPTFLREYDKLARQCATEGADHVRYLVRLTELELIDRERRMVERRIRQARFPAVKSLDSFDFKAIASLNKMLVLELARCEYVERRENVIALGNSGTGKTHIALGLGLAACQIRAAPLQPTLRVDTLEVAHQVHTEVAPGWHRRRPHHGRVIGLADRLGEAVEAALDQYQLQAVVKYMTWRARHLRPAHHQVPLTILLLSHRHQRTPLQASTPENQTMPTSSREDFVNGLL